MPREVPIRAETLPAEVALEDSQSSFIAVSLLHSWILQAILVGYRQSGNENTVAQGKALS